MNSHHVFWISIVLSPAFLLSFAGVANGQTGATPGPNTAPNMKVGRDTSPLNAENTLEMSNPQEDTAFKTFEAISIEQLPKKIKSGEDFLKKYSSSRYRPQVYSVLAVAYIQSGQTEKGLAAGESSITLNPNDVRTMAVLSQSLARLYKSSEPDAAAKLAKAEQYGQKAVELTPTLKKPDGASDQEFLAYKKETLAMAYSGLGLVSIRKGSYSAAIPDLEQATKLDAKKDPVNYYLLGVANQNSSHFAEAAAAFTKCAEFPGNMQETCKSAAEEAKKRAPSQPPVPK
jgi:tetratricopeptide (TPR) repeat protein